MDVLTHWHILFANFFSEGGAYNIGCDENVTCHGLVLNILALHLTQRMMETVRLKFIRRIMTMN